MTTSSFERPAAVKGLGVLLLYINLDQRWRGRIPQSIWAKKVENAATKSRQTAKRSEPLFKAECVDAYFSIDDLTRKNYVPTHLHLMVREHGGFRIRVTFVPRKDTKELITEEEFIWVLKLLNDHYVDAMAYRNTPTEHLPFEHINLSLANPQRKGKATSVESVQIFKGELSLIVDPDTTQDATNRAHRESRNGRN